MEAIEGDVLAVNAGSSSIKFALYRMNDPPQRRLVGKLDRIGLQGTTLAFSDPIRSEEDSEVVGVSIAPAR